MAHQPFVHLHVHSEYSLLDGAIRMEALVKKAASLDMPAIALTDHGNLFGTVEFYQTAEKYTKEAEKNGLLGVKPIIGCEIYVAPGSMHEKKTTNGGKDAAFHMTLLAANDAGYRNLVKLSTAAHLEGFYYKPRVDRELLAKHSEGLIALSGCLKGEVNMALTMSQTEKAIETAAAYRDIFGRENFFIELSDHGIEQQRRNRSGLIDIARDLDLGLVATNDVHFLERSHHEAHDVMICIGTGAMIHDERRMRYVPELYFKSGDEMAALFADRPDAISNTLAIAERCNAKLEFGQSKYPDYLPPEGKTREGYLRELSEEGLRKRYGERAIEDQTIRDRFEFELSVLYKTGFTSYFLIVWDFINYAKSRGIPVGPGRGSAAGSLIAYVLGITDLDPLRYGLLFERFLNPDRISPPDIDVDFCQFRRGEVIEYVREKYGKMAVSQIITFGTLGAKSVVRDVGRALGWSYGDADRIAKMIPNELNITLTERTKDGKTELGAIEKNPELKKAVEEEQATAQLWGYATILEGLSRNSGVHAAGVVIADRDLSEYIPLTRANDGNIVSQYSMAPLTDLGLLKMDFLGLKTLTVIDDAVKLIRRQQPDFDISAIPMDDQATFSLLNRGESVGVFQLESGGMTATAKRFQIEHFTDIIALIALYRPGPMQFIDDYIERKRGRKKIEYAHPLLEKICSETYGIIVYQEQVQQAASALAGYTLGQADLLRRAMGKKDMSKMAKEREVFVEGCATVNKIPAKQANAIFDFLEKFAQYGFNKSHSAAYGLISYQTAYLKANHPVEFMAGLLGNEINNTEKIATFVGECARMGIKILPPDVNRSALTFLPEEFPGGKAIRFGLAAIKNVGEAAMEAAVADREANGPFKSLEDFCSRLDSRTVNKKILESLVKCGAFDWEKRHRAALILAIDGAMGAAASVQQDRASGQVSLFDSLTDLAPPPSSTSGHGKSESDGSSIERWSRSEQLGHEKELLGFYVTGHPLDDYRGNLESGSYGSTAEALLMTEPGTIRLAGVLATVEKKFTKKDGRPFGVMILEDDSGTLEMSAWEDSFTKHELILKPGNVISCNVKVVPRDSAIRATANDFKALTPKPSKKALRLRMDRARLIVDDLHSISAAIKKHPGKRTLILEIGTLSGKIVPLQLGEEFTVGDEMALRAELAPWLAKI
jgi:DNA polymerase-3 subunit alpha